MLLNINPDTRGRVPEEDLATYAELGKAIELLYKEPIARHFRQKMHIGRQKKWTKFRPFRGLSGSVVLMEDVAKFGQQVMEYKLKIKTKAGWISLAEEGLTIGHKRIHPFPKELAMEEISGISLQIRKIVTNKHSIILREVSIYNWDEAAKQNLI